MNDCMKNKWIKNWLAIFYDEQRQWLVTMFSPKQNEFRLVQPIWIELKQIFE